LNVVRSVGTRLFSCVALENSSVRLEMILGESQKACYAWALIECRVKLD
jgi:hypothetical protein